MLICTSTFIMKFNKPIINSLTNTTEISEETDKCRDVVSVSRRVLERLGLVSPLQNTKLHMILWQLVGPTQVKPCRFYKLASQSRISNSKQFYDSHYSDADTACGLATYKLYGLRSLAQRLFVHRRAQRRTKVISSGGPDYEAISQSIVQR